LLKGLQDEFAASGRLRLVQTERLTELFDLLTLWHQDAQNETTASPPVERSLPLVPSPQPPQIPDLITLGDYWLEEAVANNLIQPLRPQDWSQWQALPRPWRQLVQRNPAGEMAPDGQVWAAPYRWTSLAIAYRVAPFQDLGWMPADWGDLWEPELQGQLALPENARAVIGIVLKSLEQSVNSRQVADNPAVEAAFADLHRQVRLYSSDAYLQPLLVGDIWAAVGWATDIASLVEGDRRFAAVIPASGTILSADLWVRPAAPAHGAQSPAQPSEERIARWIDYFWEPDNAVEFSRVGHATSPVITATDRDTLPRFLRDNKLLLPPRQTLVRSEFLESLPEAIAQDYLELWVRVRQMD
jgi:putative spermidine/putrescine transport system substrate-binding protein